MPKPSGEESILINRGLNGSNGTASFPHHLLQALNGLRREVLIARLDVFSRRDVFNELEASIKLNVIRYLFSTSVSFRALSSAIVLSQLRQKLLSLVRRPVFLLAAGRFVWNGRFQPSALQQGFQDLVPELGSVLSGYRCHQRTYCLFCQAVTQNLDLVPT